MGGSFFGNKALKRIVLRSRYNSSKKEDWYARKINALEVKLIQVHKKTGGSDFFVVFS
jgi:hypothetical protein